jgi:hypothetical protein
MLLPHVPRSCASDDSRSGPAVGSFSKARICKGSVASKCGERSNALLGSAPHGERFIATSVSDGEASKTATDARSLVCAEDLGTGVRAGTRHCSVPARSFLEFWHACITTYPTSIMTRSVEVPLRRYRIGSRHRRKK